MTWFLMNVLLKTRLYFEPPSQGYGRSAVDILSRLFIPHEQLGRKLLFSPQHCCKLFIVLLLNDHNLGLNQ